MSKALLASLNQVLGETAVLDPGAAREPYLVDQRGYYHGAAAAVVCPRSTDQVAQVLRIAGAHRAAVVPQGGNTGLCGGATPDSSGTQIVLSLARLNTIRELDPSDATMTVEAGVILHDIHLAAAGQGLYFPLDLAARGSCQIGGNLATNAGGTNVLRYGNARDLVLGLEVVLADGTLLSGLSRLRKDNTGYDLKQLFLGSEGTLGIITAAVLKLFPDPLHRRTALLAVSDASAACRLLGDARRRSGDLVESFEYISRAALDCVLSGFGKTDPFETRHEHYVLLELASGADEEILDRLLERILERGMDDGAVRDGVLAQSERQRAELWALREQISEAQKHSVKNDVAVPISRLPRFLDEAAQRVAARAPDARPCPFGHFGDGNLHYNILAPVGADAAAFRQRHGAALIEGISDLAMRFDGSFSAEHGIGQLRRPMMERYKSPEALVLMRQLKQMLDPQGILNPGKVL